MNTVKLNTVGWHPRLKAGVETTLIRMGFTKKGETDISMHWETEDHEQANRADFIEVGIKLALGSLDPDQGLESMELRNRASNENLVEKVDGGDLRESQT